jgi:four helix bundle protein
MMDGGLEKLNVWGNARALAVRIYREAIPKLPPEERWGLADQRRRASVSVVSNIAEGYGRYYFRERVRFSYMARGSLEEVGSLLVLAADLGYLDPEAVVALKEAVRKLMRQLNAYIQFLRRQPATGSGRRRLGAPPQLGG